MGKLFAVPILDGVVSMWKFMTGRTRFKPESILMRMQRFRPAIGSADRHSVKE
jgi:hypothetical protein